MPPPTPRILFISVDAGRSGVPVMLLHLVRWLRKNTDWHLALALDAGGDLLEEFRSVLPTSVVALPPGRKGDVARAIRKLKWRSGVQDAKLNRLARAVRSSLPAGEFDLVYCNSVAAARLLDRFKPFNGPVVVHVHELHYVLHNVWWLADCLKMVRQHATGYIACCGAVKTNLEREGIPAQRIDTVYEFIDTTAAGTPLAPGERASLLRSEGIAEESLLIGFVGTLEWRKGADLLVPLARAIRGNVGDRAFALLWLGGGLPESFERLRFDIATAGLGDVVKLPGPSNRVHDWVRCFDVFGLLSREDPYPLAALEAAAAGVPIVCFADGGGLPEFVGRDAGLVVPYLDLNAFGEAVSLLITDAERRRRMGSAAATRVRAQHDVSLAAPQIVSCIEKALGPKLDPTSSS